jgi:hypothetical protein
MAGRSITLSRTDLKLLRREHVTEGYRWGQAIGTDYWLQPNPTFDEAGAASTATTDELAEAGWTATSLVNTAGSAADFADSTDMGVPNHFLTNASGDLLSSPTIFGDYAHGYAASRIMGRTGLPRFIYAEFFGSMSVFSANEPRSGWGFFEDGGTVSVQADQFAFIATDATNFTLANNAGTAVAIGTADASWHRFTIKMDRVTGLAYAAIDGTYSANTITLITDEFPLKFGFHALTTNRPLLGLTHVWYDW